MNRYIVQKLISLLLVQFGISVVVFYMIRLVPGDAVDYIYGLYMSSGRIEEIRALWGLDRPLVVQYLEWIGRVLQLDFGRSLISGYPIADEIFSRLPVTLHLSFMAGTWSVIFGVTLGVIASRYPNGKIDGLVTTTGILGLAMPHFWLATLLVLVFAVYLNILPSVGYVSLFEDPVESTLSLMLPSLALGTTMAAAVMRMARSAMLDVLAHEYIRTARAKGVRERRVFSRHALRNAFIPVLTLIGTETGKLLGGSLIIEQIFAIPGHRPVRGGGRAEPGLPGASGHHDRHRRQLRDHQHAGGHWLRAAGSAGTVRLGGVMTSRGKEGLGSRGR